jgi:hypothetical protein
MMSYDPIENDAMSRRVCNTHGGLYWAGAATRAASKN